MLANYHVDKAIISCKGIDISAGFTDSDDLHANNKRTMLKAAKQKILAIDSSKFDKIAFTEIGTLDDITTVITDEKPEDKWLQVFNNSGVGVSILNKERTAMKSFDIKTRIYFGDQALDRLAEIPYQKVLVITDPFIAREI